MWNDPNPDPGGTNPPKTFSTQELSDLRDQNEQQLVLIAQLKEMLRKEQSSVPQEKVEEYVNTLGRRNKKAKKKDSGSSSTISQSTSANIDVNKKEKINLLRQQLEENKARLAERGKSQRGIEEMVTQLQAQINESQLNITPLSSNIIIDNKNVSYSKNMSSEELYNILLSKEKKVTELLNKVQKLEGNMMDLQENLKEKDAVIDARTKAITLMTDSLSKKGKNTLDALEDTKEQMRKMQEHFIKLESDMKARQVSLLNDLKNKNMQISDLEEEKNNLKKLLDENNLSQTDGNESILFQKRLEESRTENEQLVFKISELQLNNSELEKKVEETSLELRLLKNIGGPSEETSKESIEEIEKLKKQLDESNKSMIKVKAQHKNKIKELNKKIEQLKKSSESSSLIEELQSENVKLSEKVAELEEELGNIQLKMVDSTTSSNGSLKLEELIKELEETVSKRDNEIEDKDKIISLLESEILSLKEQINTQNDNLKNLSVSVSSEINSINYEEQLEIFEKQNKTLLSEKQELLSENISLKEKIDSLSKEKHEISLKLETYIQENMELIDKLEKLSAEKVSSSESIEIVEGLTQQEKIELAAYQNQQIVEEVEQETPVELNESVLQLSEDTAELLQKIEMFTQERKEVMLKMELLREENNKLSEENNKLSEENNKLIEENNKLSVKIKEIENNRDVLVETYEQLQNEKEDLQNKLEELEKNKNESSNDEEINNYKFIIEENKKELISSSSTINELNSQLLHKENEIQELNTMIEDLNKIINEQNKESTVDVLENQLKEVKDVLNTQLQQAQEYENELNENSNTIKDLNLELLEMNRKIVQNELDLQTKLMQLKEKEEIIINLQKIIEEKDKKFNTVNEEIREKYMNLQKQLDGNKNSLEDKVNELSNKNKELVEKLKKVAANLKKRNQQYKDLEVEYNSQKEKWENELKEKEIKIEEIKVQSSNLHEEIDSPQMQIQIELQQKIEEVESIKNIEIEKYKNQIKNLEDNLRRFEDEKIILEEKFHQDIYLKISELKEKEQIIDNLQKNIEELQNKFENLQQQFNLNDYSNLQISFDELSNKNKEQLEKLKKLAANLKKRNQQYKDLEIQFNSEKEKWEIESKEKDTIIDESNEKLLNTIQQLNELKEEIKLLKNQHESSPKNEINLQQELSSSLHEDFTEVSNSEIQTEKIRELEMIIESNEQEIENLNQRIIKLESDLNKIEEDKNMVQQKNNELEEKLSLTSNSFKEKAMLEDQLELKLAEISATDEMLNKKLNESGKENEELLRKNVENEDIIKKLKLKLKKAQDKVNELKNLESNFKELEIQNETLTKQITILETNQRQIQNENESLQKRNLSDYEKIEADYQIQLEELTKAKNDLSIECEKLQEKIPEVISKVDELQQEVDDYKLRLTQNDQEINSLQDQINRLTVDKNKIQDDSNNTIALLKNEISELQNEILLSTAKSTVENVISEAILNISSVGCQTDTVENIPHITVDNTQHTVDNTQHTIDNTQHTVDSTQHTVDNTQHTVDSTQHTLDNTQHTVDSTQHTIDFTQPTIDFTQYTVEPIQHTVDSAQDQQLTSVIPTFHWPGQESTSTVIEVQQKEKSISDLFNQPQQHTVDANPSLDWFNQQSTSQNEAQQNTTQQFTVENSKEALLNKIKTLEFLLYNVDKEKEIALSECTEMINELSEIIYEKINSKSTVQSSQNVSDLESQIMTQQDIVDMSRKEDLNKVEYEETRPSLGQQNQPVVEDVIQPKEAYVTYVDDGQNVAQQLSELEQKLLIKSEELERVNKMLSEKDMSVQQLIIKVEDMEKKINQQLEVINEQSKRLEEYQNAIKDLQTKNKDEDICSQILSNEDIAEASNKKTLQQIEYTATNPLFGEQSHPVVEEIQKPKNAYLTYSEEKPQSFEAFEENDDGWGWGPEEARLEEEHIQKTENIPQIQNLRLEIQNLNEQVRVLLIEKESYVEEIKQLQNKSGKLIKKYKEVKMQNEELVSKKSQGNEDNFFNLDQTIQDELKIQIEQLEKKLKESINELDKEKKEKNNILKRVDVLASANERMIEMKEIQDSEVLRLQRKCNELSEKIEKNDEWGNDGFDEKPAQKIVESDDSKKIEELEKMVQELSLDNEELQTLLEEQRNLRVQAETSNKNSVEIGELINSKTILEKHISELQIKVQQNETQIKEMLDTLNEKENQIEQLKKMSSEKDDIINNLNQQFTLKTNIDNELQTKIENLEKILHDKQNIIDKLQHDFESLNATKYEEIENLQTKLNEFENNIQNKEKEFENKLKETTAQYEILVDQRGTDVAESWKLHLENVEREFSNIQYKLTSDLSEMEEKCNALVNENNELRKNVDTEIRNEVDRISGLQQQITNNQHVISNLNNDLEVKKREIEDLERNLSEKENKLLNINVIIETTQKQFDEKREVVEELVKILEKNSLNPISYDKNDILNELQRQLNIYIEKESEIERLNKFINDLQLQVNTLSQKDAEIDKLTHIIDEFQKKINTISEKDNEITKLNNVIINLQHQLEIIGDKDSEILKLNSLIEENSLNQTAVLQENIKLQNEHKNCAIIISDYQQQILQYRQSYDALNQQLVEATIKLQQISDNKEVESLKKEIDMLNQQCAMLQNSLEESRVMLNDKNQQYEIVEQQLNYSQQNYELSQNEVQRLTNLLQQKEFEYNSIVENMKQGQINDLEKYYNEILLSKDEDIIKLRSEIEILTENNEKYLLKLDEYNNDKKQLEEIIKNLEEKLNESSNLSDDERKQITELGQIIEDQVLKIEELKKELFEKSNLYDSLIAEMDISRKAITEQPSSSTLTPQNVVLTSDSATDDTVSRAELDIALYMLHQRDVKCEELTVELTHLLEERDTLQLRLSNAMREKEELRRKYDVNTSDISNVGASTSSSSNTPSKASEIFLAASGTELAKEPVELASKLSELKQVGYKKDKTFVDEQELRRLQQMSIMQEHIQEASKLPPEAVAKLVDASYTLSRDVQSPSKVLLNWLWGKSTPRVDEA